MRNKNSAIWLWSFIVLSVFGVFGGAYYKYADRFVTEAPVINLPQELCWNLKTPLRLSIASKAGVVSYKISVIEDGKQQVIEQKELQAPLKSINLNLIYPKNGFLPTTKNAIIKAEIKDSSWWNFFAGNKTVAEAKISADAKPPLVSIVGNSYMIAKGGSALVIFEAKDENLLGAFIRVNGSKIFRAQPFYKTGFYATLVAWPIDKENFTAEVMAADKAMNISTTKINFFLKQIAYKNTDIQLKNDFVDGKILELSSVMPNAQSATPAQRFIFVNSTLRAQNEKIIESLTAKIENSQVDSFISSPLLPISRASVVGSFGDHRNFFLNGEKISESYHMGIDFASTKEAVVNSPANGKIVYSAQNGIYGNMLAVSHGLGLFTIYGHCSSLLVKEKDSVSYGQPIVKTGTTGLALGDHLHYGVVVQGIEVRPIEWLDEKWIKLNIVKVIEDSKNIINGRKN